MAALIAALVSVAIAGSLLGGRGEAAGPPGITKQTVKKIANKQIKKQAPSLSVARAHAVDTVVKSGVIKLAKGQTKTVMVFGPFKLTAECSDSGGNPRLDIVLSSTQIGSVFDSGGAAGAGTFGGPATIPWLDQTSSGATWYGYDFNLAAPTGATYTGSASGGVNVLGAPCAATAFAIG